MRILLVNALLSLSAFAVQAHARPADQPAGERAQLELVGVSQIGEGAATLLILREKGSRTILPLLLPGDSGRSLGSDLQSRRAPDLLGVTLRALGARVQEVELLGSKDEVQTGRARVAQGHKVVDVAGRPSELVALAVTTGAPMYIGRRLLAEAGLTPEDIERARQRLAAHDDRSTSL